MREKISSLKNFSLLLHETFVQWKDDGGTRLGASLSFYTAFSLAPLLLLSISIAGYFFGAEVAHGKILEELQNTMGNQAAETIQSMIQAAQRPTATLMATIIGGVTLLLGASVVMSDLKYTLNKIWHVKSPAGITLLVKDKLLSIGMVLVIGFLLLVSLLVSTFLAAVGNYCRDVCTLPEWMVHVLNSSTSFLVITLLFAAIFKILPNAKIKWRDVWVGAGLTSALFTLGKAVLSIYLAKGTVGSSYGAAGSVLVILLWLYYSAQILYFGAEFTKIHADRYGSAVKARAKQLKT
jgi:membrane protein